MRSEGGGGQLCGFFAGGRRAETQEAFGRGGLHTEWGGVRRLVNV